MTGSSALFRLMLRLALGAALLMAIAPTVSRVLTATGAAHVPILMELCTSRGLKMVDVAPYIATEAPVATTHEASDTACGYCLLVTPLPLLLLAMLGLCIVRAAAPPSRLATLVLPRPRNHRGLGSQGPPLAL